MNNLVVLIGAGFSVDMGLPLAWQISEHFGEGFERNAFRESSSEWRWKKQGENSYNDERKYGLSFYLSKYRLENGIGSSDYFNYEEFYAYLSIQQLAKDENEMRSFFTSLLGRSDTVDHIEISELQDIFQYLVADLLIYKSEKFQANLLKYHSFITKIQNPKYTKVVIITLNHDVLLESLLNTFNLPFHEHFSTDNSPLVCDDGSPQYCFNINPDQAGITITKLHSDKYTYAFNEFDTNYYIETSNRFLTGRKLFYKTRNYNKKQFAHQRGFKDALGNPNLTPRFITGTNKSELMEKDEYYSQLYEYSRQAFLHGNELLICGLSFADVHVNELINLMADKKITNVNPNDKVHQHLKIKDCIEHSYLNEIEG